MLKAVERSKALAAAGDYAAGDVMSESASAGTPFRFEDLPESGYIVKAQAICSTTALTPRLSLYLFSRIPTCVLNDNVASTAPLAADRNFFQGVIDFPAMEDLGTGESNTIATPNTVGNLPLAFETVREGKLWGILVTRDAIAGEAAGMTLAIKLTVEE